MPVFRGIMPVLRVTDLDRAVEWYTRVLGLEVAWRSPNDGGGENCMLHLGDVSVLLSTGSHLRLPPALTGTLYFETDGVREFWEKVKGQAEIVWPLETMDYGTLEFGIRDPDGYTLAFSEDASKT
jgi:catechol 2,3-dioxygenase-like lactoylglutathione lyase family enzyme